MAAQPISPQSVGANLEAQDFASGQQDLLDLIDKLQFAQLDNVKLPHIVVVGDQSAGKSSVLEAITGTPFPREAGACTRFATEIRLRRSKEEKFSVHIIPDRSTRNFADQDRLAKFGGTVNESTLFDVLMNQAVEQIAPKGIPGRFATRDVLVVEKQGPSMPLLTLVDLPGLVQNPNNDQSKEDIKAINHLTNGYMRNPRTIILAVIGGNGDFVQAPVLIRARYFDPTGARTIGVLTKPDLTSSIGLEDKFIALVNNKDKENELKLGWYVLLNPGPRKRNEPWPSPEERAQREIEFFKSGKWSELPPEMRGATALKQKLSVQLQRHIGKHVKVLRKEINKSLDECETELKTIGEGRDSVKEMREDLAQLCADSKDLVNPAVHGTYKNPAGKSFFPSMVDQKGTPPQNLRARAVEENQKFARRVRDLGHKFNFSSSVDPSATVNRPEGLSKEEYARREVEPLLRQNKGTEFPTDHNPRLVYTLFQNHSKKWTSLSQEHKENLGMICSEFLAEVIDDVWPGRMREPLRRVFLDPQMNEIMEKAQIEVETLKKDQHYEVQPYDPEYETRLKNWHAAANPDRPYTVAEEVLEKMLIHYELSAKIFIMNVITQVWRMKNEDVEAIASENKEARDKRMTLKTKKKAIEEARDLCANLAMRKELRVYGDEEFSEEDEDEEQSSLTASHEASSSKTLSSDVVVTTARKPAKLQQPAQVEVQPPRSDASMTNGTNGYGTASAEYYPDPRRSADAVDVPQTPDVWTDQAATDYYQPVNRPQSAAPAPPPRPGKILQADDNYPTTPPASSTRPAFPNSDYSNPPRETSGQYAHSYTRSDTSQPPADYDQYSTGGKTSRKIFGKKW
ncbi:hypothetical protein G7Y89_g1436 [Cudoniella acicularis]|uniref:Dynamin-type G domain-containing protein n=1 Tax=Cudoniella acicularis TaxID=354080 RepID=A0A8H4RWX8_9HELO|nr:hypothetical protein G7Y89_g1436 [Cudoniella acicularis]